MRRSVRALALILMALMLVGMMPFALFAEGEQASETPTEPETPVIDTTKPYPEQIADYVTSVGGTLWYANDFTGIEAAGGNVASAVGGSLDLQLIPKTDKAYVKDGAATVEGVLGKADDPFINFAIPATQGGTIVIEGSYKLSEVLKPVVDAETGEQTLENLGIIDGISVVYMSDRTGGASSDGRLVTTKDGYYVTAHSGKVLAKVETDEFVNIKVVAVQALNIAYFYVDGEYMAYDVLYTGGMNKVVATAGKNNDKIGFSILRFAHLSGTTKDYVMSVSIDDLYIYLADQPYNVNESPYANGYINNTLLPYLVESGNRLIAGTDFEDDRYTQVTNQVVVAKDPTGNQILATSGNSIDGMIFYDAYYNITKPETLNYWNEVTMPNNYKQGSQWQVYSNLHNLGHIMPHVKYTLARIEKEANGNHYLAYEQGNPWSTDSYMDIYPDNMYTPSSKFVLSGSFSRFDDTTTEFSPLFQFRLNNFANGQAATAADGSTTKRSSSSTLWVAVLVVDTYGRVFARDYDYTVNDDKTITSVQKNVQVGQLFVDEFTTLSVAVDPKTNTMSTYVNGKLVHTGCFANPTEFNQFTFDGKVYVYDNSICNQFAPASIRMATNKSLGTKSTYGGLNIDNLLWYTGDMPVEAANTDTTALSGWVQSDNGYWRYYKDGIALLGEQTIDGQTYYFEKDNAYVSEAERVELFDLIKTWQQYSGDKMASVANAKNLVITDMITGSKGYTMLWADIYKNADAASATNIWSGEFTIPFSTVLYDNKYVKMNSAYAVNAATSDSYTAWRFNPDSTYYDLTDFTAIEMVAYSNMDINTGWVVLLNSDGLSNKSIGYNSGSWYDFGDKIRTGSAYANNYSVTMAKPKLVISEGWNTFTYNMQGVLPTAGNQGTLGQGRGGNLSNIVSFQISTSWSSAAYGVENMNELMLYFDSISFVKHNPVKEVPAAGFRTTAEGTYYYKNTYDYATGWNTIEGEEYYFFPYNGLMAVGNVAVDGVGYQFDDNGKLIDSTADGFFTVNGIECIFIDGVLQTGAFTYDDVNYYANANGKIWSKVGTIGYEYEKAYTPAVYEGRELNFLMAQNFDKLTAGTFFGSYADDWNSTGHPFYGSVKGTYQDTTLSLAKMVITAKNTHFNVVSEGAGDNALELTQVGGLVDSYINVNMDFKKTEVEAGKKYTYEYKMPDGTYINAAQSIVLEYDLKLGADWDHDVSLGQLIGYEGTNGSRTFGNAVARINYQGYVYLGGDKTKVLCKLDTEEYTNIAIVFNQTTYTYSFYVNGVCKIDDVSYGKSNGWIITELRTFHGESSYNNGSLFVDNFYVYIGETPSLYDPTYVVTKPQNGWVTEGGVTRYYEDGFMRMSAIEAEGPDGVVRYYNFDALNGSLIGTANGFVGGKFYRNGELVANEWVDYEGAKYYINADSAAAKGAVVVDATPYYFNTATGALEKNGVAESMTLITVDQILDDTITLDADYTTLKDGLMYTAKADNGKETFSVNCLDPIDLNGYDYIAYDIWLGGDDYTAQFLTIVGHTDTLYHLERIENTVENEDGTTTTTVEYAIHEDGQTIYRDYMNDLEGTWVQDSKQQPKVGDKKFTAVFTLTNGDNVEYYGRLWSYTTISGSFEGMHAGWNTVYIPVSAIGANYRGSVTHIGMSTTGWSLDTLNKGLPLNDYEYYFGEVRAIKLGDTTVKNGWVDGKYYENSSIPSTGWVTIDGSTYYFDGEGNKLSGFTTVGGVLYEFDEGGVLVGEVNGMFNTTVGTLVPNEKYKNFDWVTYEIERIYMDGYFQTGKVTFDGVTYICDGNGAIVKGQTLVVDGYLYECAEDGAATALAKQWYTDENGNTYYAGNNGKLNVNVSAKIDGFFYAFDENGLVIKNGFFTVGTSKRYFDADGKGVLGKYDEVIVGYNEDGTPIYKSAYFNPTNGLMTVPADNMIDGVEYVFDEDGFIKYVAHDHEYDNNCDATCNICGEEREVAGHAYNGVVTAPTCVAKGYTTYTCANCGDYYVSDETAATGVHTYDNDSDADCNECGEIREVEDLIASGKCGEFAFWKLRTDGTLVIYGEGSTEDYLVNIAKDQPYRAYQSQITKVIIEEGILAIGRGAFYSFTSITSVELPDSLIAIHEYAFFSCSKITTLNIPANTFYIGLYSLRKTGLTSVTFENAEGWSFDNGVELDFSSVKNTADALKTKNYKYTCMRPVEGEGDIVASGVFGAKEEFNWTLSSTGVLNVYGTGNMPKFNVNTTPWYGYRGAIRSVVINEGITSVGRCSFHTCRAITNVTLPESLETIAEYAFYNCPFLTSVVIPANVTRIEIFAFRKCLVLKDVTFEINYGWYAGSDKVSATEINGNAADMLTLVNYTKIWTRDVNAEEEVLDPNYVTGGACNTKVKWGLYYIDDTKTKMKLTISGKGAMPQYQTAATPWYGYLDNIVEIEVAEGVTEIGRCAFYGLKFVKTVTLPAGLVTIGEYAFNTCLLMKSITIPSTVETIGLQAFGKTGLTSVVFESRTGWTVNGTVLATNDMADAATAAEYLKNTYKASALARDPATVEEAPANGWFAGNFYVDGAMVTNTEMYIGVDYYAFDANGNYEVVANDGEHTANY